MTFDGPTSLAHESPSQPLCASGPSLGGGANAAPSLFQWEKERRRADAKRALDTSRILRLGDVRKKEREFFRATAACLVGDAIADAPRPTPEGSRHLKAWAIRQSIPDSVDALCGDERADDTPGYGYSSTQGDRDRRADAGIRCTSLEGVGPTGRERQREDRDNREHFHSP